MTFQSGYAFIAEKPKSSKQTFDLYHVTITYIRYVSSLLELYPYMH